jgi:signal transduction histidine kinase
MNKNADVAPARSPTIRREERLRLVAEVSDLLVSTPDFRATLPAVARLLVPRVADSCTLLYYEGENLVRVLAHRDPSKEERVRAYWAAHPHDPSSAVGLEKLLRTGEVELRPELSDKDLEDWTRDPALVEFMRGLSIASAVVVPLQVRDRRVGALCLMSEEAGWFDEEDREFALRIARRCTVAVENARLYEAQRHAIERLSRLQRVTAALGAAMTEEDVADVIVSEAVAALGATVAVVSTLNEGGSWFRNVRYAGYPEDVIARNPGFAADAPVPVADAVRRREPILLGSLAERRERYPQLEAFRESYAGGALVALPMYLGDRPIGGLGFIFPHDREFPPEDREFLLALAQECAQALERARLFQRARNAVALRDDFLSVAGHELRSPAHAIGLIAESLVRRLRSGESAERLAEGLERLRASVGRLTDLTRVLLDVAHIAEGRLTLERAPTDLAVLARNAARNLDEVARRAGCAIGERLEPVTGEWDQERIEQVITNLLSNACKFGEGNPVEIVVEKRPGGGRLSVQDHGIGIDPVDQPRLFRRFERLESRRRFGGMGLGLWICRRIVEAHGGHIGFESEPGVGSTFWFEVPTL